MKATRLVVLGGAVALLAGRVPAQEPPAPPVFRADVDMVAVDVNVIDDRGWPVRGLQAGDFTVTVDGQARTVVSAEFIDAGHPDDAPPPPPTGNFTTNEHVRQGRVLVIVVDQGSIRPGAGRQVLFSADRLLDNLGPRDHVGLLTMPGGGPQVELTTEHARVRNALKHVMGRANFSAPHVSLTEALEFDEGRDFEWDQVVQRECSNVRVLGNPGGGGEAAQASQLAQLSCRQNLEGEATMLVQEFRHQASVSMKGLHRLMETMRQIDGPKTVVLITEALRSERNNDLRDLAVKAAAARVSFYGIQIEDRSPDPQAQLAPTSAFEDADILTRDLYRLSSLTRGEVFRSTGSSAPLERISREISGYYLLGFEPGGNDRDGKEHTIDVKVGPRDVTVRARRSLPLVPSATGALGGREAVAAAIRSPFLSAELPLRVATYAVLDRQSTDKVRVVVTADVGRGDVGAAGLHVGFALVGPTGKVVASSVQEVDAAALEGGAASDAGPVPYLGSVLVEPGQYTLKMAAVDARGRRGSVIHEVKGALTTAGDISMSDLILAPPADKPGVSLRPGVDALAEGGALAAVLELHGPDQALKDATVTLEVAAREDGEALLRAPARVSPAGPSGRAVQGFIPVGLLPAGRYTARAVLASGGRPEGQVTRSFAVSPRAASAGSALAGFVPASVRFDPALVLAPDVLTDVVARLRRAAGARPAGDLVRAMDDAAQGKLNALADGLRDTQEPSLALHFLRGLGLLAEGQTAAAHTQFRGAVRQRPDFTPAVVYLGAASAALGQDQEAVGAWNTALLQEEGSPLVPMALADALMRLRETADAVDVLKEALARWPDDARLRGRLGLAYALAGRGSEAMPLLEEHLQRQPQDTDALFATVRLLYEPLRVGTTGGDRARFERYAHSYVEAKAPQSALVAEWLKAVDQPARP